MPIVIPVTNTTITSAWGKSVADALNAMAGDQFLQLTPNVDVPTTETAYTLGTFTAPVAGTLTVHGLVTLGPGTIAGVGRCIARLGPTSSPAPTAMPYGTGPEVAVNTYNATIPIIGRMAVTAAQSVTIRVAVTALGNVMKLPHIAVLAHLNPT